MEDLQREAKELKRIESKVQKQFKRAKKAEQEIDEREIDEWLKEAQKIGEIIYNWPIDEKAKPSWMRRFFLSNHQAKKSKEDASNMINQVNALVDRGKSILVENFNTDTKGIELVWRDDFVEFESRIHVLNRIMDALKDEEDGIIGVFGMGGIGKTKLAVEIGKKAQDEKLFSKVVMATVSQSPDIRNIQGTLADMANLEEFKEDTETGRSDELRKKLGKERKVLVILDDVWEKIDIERIGIPKGCRIVLTTRSEDVCQNMGCISSMCLNQITYEEAKSLFRRYSSEDWRRNRRPNLEKWVEKIVKECGGLPLALVTVGSALRHKGLEEYKHAARKLSESSFVGIEAVDRNIYASLKLSYDYLDDIEIQKCFLLCSLYPEDAKIKVEVLTSYAYGLCLFRNVESVDHARQKMIASISKLEKACLLSLVKDEDEVNLHVSTVNYLSIVKMHDVIRDVALWIARSDGLFLVPTSLTECRGKDMSEKRIAVYLNSQDLLDHKNFPQELECPNLEILLLYESYRPYGVLLYQSYGPYGVHPITLPVNFFRKASSLRVLDLGIWLPGDCLEMSLQVSVQYLVNLKVLRILGTHLRNDVGMSILHNLKSLEILELGFLSDVKVLPGWIGELCNLRVLNLSESEYLEEIPPNLLPKLAKLEELYTPLHHQTTWSHAFLSDLTFLRHLSVFTGWFSKSRALYSLPRHRILKLDDFNDDSVKMLAPGWAGVTHLEIGMLCVEGIQNLCPYFDNSSFLNLRKLELYDSKSLECLIDTTTERGQRLRSAKVLPNLFELSLFRMKQLCRICIGPPPHLNFLGNLRSLQIDDCPRIEYLIPVASPLRRLKIWSCGALKSLYDPVQTTSIHQLPNLSCESDKQKLVNVGHGDAELHTMTLDAMLVSLTDVEINDCSNLEEVFPSVSEINNQHCNWKLMNLIDLNLSWLPKLECIWKVPHQNYCLHNLKTLDLCRCDKLSSVFTTTLAQTLVKLESLHIIGCAMLETIISPDEQDEPSKKMPHSSTSGRTSFQELRYLTVTSCHKLKTVLPMMFSAKCLPKLEDITINDCEALDEVFGTREGNKTDSQTQDVVIQHLRLELVFQELRHLDVRSCHKLKTVLPMMFAAKCLPKLESIRIINCEALEEVFGTQEENKIDSQTQDVMMQSLQHLELVDLPKLVPFSEFTWNQILLPLRKQDTDIVLVDGQEQVNSDMEVNSESSFSSVEEDFDVQDAKQPILTGLRVLKLGYVAKVQCLLRGPAEFFKLSNLKKIKVYNCPAIKSLFPHSFCWALHSLKTVKVYNCKELKNIFEPGDHEEHSRHGWCFPKLRRLYVSNCEVLESIFPVCVVQDFSCLEWAPSSTSGRASFQELWYLEVESCHRLKTVLPMMFAAKCLSKLEAIRIINCEALEEVFGSREENKTDSQTQDVMIQHPRLELVFQELVFLVVESCHKLKTILPMMYAAKCLPKLKEITVINCEALEEVFGTREENKIDSQTQDVVMQSLKCLELVDLPKLVPFSEFSWNQILPSLETLIISGTTFKHATDILLADGQEQVANGILPIRAGGSLLNMEVNSESSFSSVEEVFDVQDAQHPILTGLRVLEFQELRYLIVESFHKLKIVLPMMFAAKCLPKLERIKISNCEALEEVFGTREENKTDSQTQDVVIQHLRLELVFQELVSLEVESCHNLKTVLPMMFAAKYLPKLKSIKIINCEALEEVFGTREENKTDSQTQDVVMQSLRHLELVDLPKLVPFSEFILNQILSSLDTLIISGTTFKQATDILLADGQEKIHNGMLPIRAAGSLQVMEVNSESFFSSVEEVFDVQDAEQPILTDLHVLELGHMAKVQRLWRGPAEFISLSNLEAIEVYNSPAIKSLFPHSFCWALHYLRTLKVYNCKELKNIFEPGDHEEHSLHGRCFPYLETLDVSNCEMLESIFPACVVQDFPRLKFPEVHDCPKLENININALNQS